MTKWAEQRICIKFWVKLERSSVETIQLIQEATTMGNWWLAALSQQSAHSCITCHTEFFVQTSHGPGDSAPLQPRFGALRLLAFPKTKITFEREEISDYGWDSEKYDRIADGDWKNCVRSQGASFEGDWGVIVLRTMFLVSCIFLNKCPHFSYFHGWVHSGQTLHFWGSRWFQIALDFEYLLEKPLHSLLFRSPSEKGSCCPLYAF